jgi:hypothetical protein
MSSPQGFAWLDLCPKGMQVVFIAGEESDPALRSEGGLDTVLYKPLERCCA